MSKTVDLKIKLREHLKNIKHLKKVVKSYEDRKKLQELLKNIKHLKKVVKFYEDRKNLITVFAKLSI